MSALDGTLRVEKDNDDVMKILKGNMGWHADSTYMPVQAKGAVFSAEVVPTIGGQTGFADMRAAYDALDDARKARVEKLAGPSLAALQPVEARPRDAEGRRRVQRLRAARRAGAAAAAGEDASRDRPQVAADRPPCPRHSGPGPAESERFLQELIDFACQRPRIYHHDWAAGDAVLWDNRCLLHQATPVDMTQKRIMWHSRIAGDPASETALAG